MIISLNDLNKWKSNSLKLAIREGYDLSILDFIEKNANLRLIRRLPPKGIWYGYCYYDQKSPEIEVYYRNLSTESIDTIVIALRESGMNNNLLEEVIAKINGIPPIKLYEIYNQSGMDHELIGHLYNNLKGLRHDERAAVETQIEFAKLRAKGIFGKNWGRIIEIMPIVLGYHKSIDEFK